jgi:hypothetical protein
MSTAAMKKSTTMTPATGRRTSILLSFDPSYVLFRPLPALAHSVTSTVQLDGIFDALAQLHDSKRADFFFNPSDFLVVGLEPSQVQVVATSFSPSQARLEFEQELRAFEAEQAELDGDGAPEWTSWREPDESSLRRQLEIVIPFHLMATFSEVDTAVVEVS